MICMMYVDTAKCDLYGLQQSNRKHILNPIKEPIIFDGIVPHPAFCTNISSNAEIKNVLRHAFFVQVGPVLCFSASHTFCRFSAISLTLFLLFGYKFFLLQLYSILVVVE